jgi:hypothetical protein
MRRTNEQRAPSVGGRTAENHVLLQRDVSITENLIQCWIGYSGYDEVQRRITGVICRCGNRSTRDGVGRDSGKENGSG